MNKNEVQQSVLQYGKPLALNKFKWNEKTRTFSTEESDLVIDFNDVSYCTFKTGSGCTFKTGSGCTFDTGSGCVFMTGSFCTFKTGYECTFKTGDGCSFITDFRCNLKTCFNCTFETSSEGVSINKGDLSKVKSEIDYKTQAEQLQKTLDAISEFKDFDTCHLMLWNAVSIDFPFDSESEKEKEIYDKFADAMSAKINNIVNQGELK